MFLLLFSSHWLWYAKGAVKIDGKSYYMRSKHAQKGFVDFDGLIVAKDMKTRKRIDKKLIDFIAGLGIKTEFEFEPGMLIVTKDKRDRYDIFRICDAHINIIDENGRITGQFMGHVDLSKRIEDLPPAAEAVKGLLRGRKLIFETHLHLNEERLQMSGDDIRNTTIGGRLTSHIVMNQRGKGRIFVPRQACTYRAEAIPLCVGLAIRNPERVEEILRDHYLIQEVDLSFLLKKMPLRGLFRQKISGAFSKLKFADSILAPSRVEIIKALDAAA